ncbi:ATP-binding protein [Aquincola sp. S2]|uniref:ATP-binding protein n=1 Tax=Pseudaquabacterium terrae TaxID=2732868 RepID=A0ABX2EC16_9BURK|nr:ATP-binding protein [Aquabacterium terrae]NRF66679.1 ATP-binding protein [Aquabacterium terrae]
MARIALSDLTPWITEAVLAHPQDLPAYLCQRLSISRTSARNQLNKLVEAQWLARDGVSRKAHYRPGALRQVVRRYPLQGLQEDLPWVQDFAGRFELKANVARIAQHVFTELLNNAIDHSGGSSVTVSMRQTPTQLQLLVSDDGRGVFNTVAERFNITDPTVAMLELAKGKLTSQPDAHTGRGLFFSAKLADIFDLHANDAAFQQREWQRDQWWQRSRPACRVGTSVYVAICVDTERTLDNVLHRYSLDGAGYGFERTVVPLKLITQTQAGLESRAQARRVASRLTQFRRVELDFEGLADVGHGFTDELFRVFGAQHPELQLVPVNMAPRVAAMIGSVREALPVAA